MELNEVLDLLCGWVGRRLTVTVRSLGGSQVVVASFGGTLDAAPELDPDAEREPTFLLRLDDGAALAFIDADELTDAHVGEDGELTLTLGTVELTLEADDEEA